MHVYKTTINSFVNNRILLCIIKQPSNVHGMVGFKHMNGHFKFIYKLHTKFASMRT
jgi:hypothetical protein